MNARNPHEYRGKCLVSGTIGGTAKGQVALTNLTLLATISTSPKGA